jgi:hypothetical protein
MTAFKKILVLTDFSSAAEAFRVTSRWLEGG